MPDTLTDTPTILLKAADVIDTRGWCQERLTAFPALNDGYYASFDPIDNATLSDAALTATNVRFGLKPGFDPDDTTTWPVDPLAAINVALGFDAEKPYEGGPPDFDERIPVVQALVKHLGGDPDVEFPDYFVAEWNDAAEQTAEQVVTALRECARDAANGARS